jgi:beta-phosphoglucomutase
MYGSDPEAMIFDFNGTLADDEPILAQLFTDLSDELLRYKLDTSEYFDVLAGLSDREIALRIAAMAGCEDQTLIEEMIRLKGERYLALLKKRSTITAAASETVNFASEICPLAIVTGAARIEVLAALSSSGLTDKFVTMVTSEDVEEGKPSPEGFNKALTLLGTSDTKRVLVFEDSAAGVIAAKAAGTTVVKVGASQTELCSGQFDRQVAKLRWSEVHPILKTFRRSRRGEP